MVDKMHIEILGETSIYFGLGVEIITAFLLGGLIGFDREIKMKSAGIKTNILICLGATLYTSLSLLNQKAGGGVADPNRIAAQVVSGIGFLGAGAIIQSRGAVIGLTTAATIWTVAAVGVTVGMGYPLVATIFTITVLIVLKLLNPIYRWIESEKYFKNYHIEIMVHGDAHHSIKEVFDTEATIINEMSEEIIDKNKNIRLINVYAKVHPRKITDITRLLRKIILVQKVAHHLVDYEIDGEE